MKRHHVVEIMGVIATLIGISKIIGGLTHTFFLVQLGNTFTFAPAPRPFVRSGGMKDTKILVFGCQAGTGEMLWKAWDYKLRSSLDGPHRRIVTLINYTIDFSQTHDNSSHLEQPIKYYLCHNGDFAKAMNCPPAVTTAAMGMEDRDTHQVLFEKRYACSN